MTLLIPNLRSRLVSGGPGGHLKVTDNIQSLLCQLDFIVTASGTKIWRFSDIAHKQEVRQHTHMHQNEALIYISNLVLSSSSFNEA